MENTENQIELKRPHEIKEYLDQYVIGQDEAKKILSVAVYNHYKRLFTNLQLNAEINKSNILMLGETGTGKTYLVKTIAKLLNIPCYIADATTLTEAGYVGDDVETILSGALQNANFDVKRTEMSIIFIDEIDKIARKSDNPSITRDVSGEGVQQALLKIVEGNTVGVPPKGGRKHPQQDLVYIDTSNILFIACGAFSGIEKNIKKRINYNSVGFNSKKNIELSDSDILKFTTAQDLKSFGLIPELIGRFPVITNTNALSEDDLVRIIKEPENAILKQFEALFEMDGTTLHFEDEAIREVAKMALELKIGARGIRSILETILIDFMYEIPRLGINTVIITSDIVNEKLNEKYRYYVA